MIKGVSKQILEVTNTENPYFERVIFFVKPEHQSENQAKLQRQAEDIVGSCKKPPKIRISRKKVITTVLGSVLFTLTGCAISVIINALI